MRGRSSCQMQLGVCCFSSVPHPEMWSSSSVVYASAFSSSFPSCEERSRGSW